MRPLPFSIIPTWLQVLRVLHLLEDDEPVTLTTFRIHDEPAWHWAVAQRTPGTQRSGHAGHSPWIHFVNGRTARSIRQIAPLWITEPDRWPITAEELEQLALVDHHVRQRFEVAKRIAALLLHEPADWSWLEKALDRLHPSALRCTDDMDDLPWEDGRRHRPGRTGAAPSPSVGSAPRFPSRSAATQSADALPATGNSKRPSLRYRRPPPAPEP